MQVLRKLKFGKILAIHYSTDPQNLMSQSINGNPFLPILLKVSIRGQPQMHRVGVSRFFPLFSEPPSPFLLSGYSTKKFKSLILQHSI